MKHVKYLHYAIKSTSLVIISSKNYIFVFQYNQCNELNHCILSAASLFRFILGKDKHRQVEKNAQKYLLHMTFLIKHLNDLYRYSA